METIETKDGVVGYAEETSVLPWCSYRKHDPNRPQARVVQPACTEESADAPSDAIVLFDGKDLSQWQPSSWKIENGQAIAGKGDLVSRQSFGDCQLHVEFFIPDEPRPFFDRGNSGVILMGLYEIQIFDSHPSHRQQIYADGQCAAIYGETPPRVNACRKVGQWQSYNIIFIAPVFEGDHLIKPAAITMFHNGVLVHLNQIIYGPVAWKEIADYKPHPPKLPLYLQGHNCPVRFRNVWIRSLELKTIDRSKPL